MGSDQSKKAPEAVLAKMAQQHLNQLASRLNSLRNSKDICDVTIACRGKEFSAHKAVLAAASPYCLEMFQSSNMSRSSDLMQLDQANPEGLSKVLDFIYTGRADITSQNVQYIMQVARLLKMDPLYSQCSNQLVFELNANTFVYTWNISDVLNDKLLQQNVMEFCCSNFKHIYKQPDFKALSRDRVLQILQFVRCSVLQDRLLAAIIQWIRVNPIDREREVTEMLDIINTEGLTKSFLERMDQSESVLEEIPVIRKYISLALLRYVEHIEPAADSKANVLTNGNHEEPLMLVLGENEKGHSIMQSYNFIDNSWSKTQIAPLNVRLMGTAVKGDKVYCLGGKDGANQYADSLYVYFVLDYKLLKLASMQIPRALLGLTEMGGKLYAVGGQNSSGILADVECYNIANDKWTTLPALPQPKSGPSCACLKKKLFVIGGRNDHAVLSTVEYYTAESNQWTMVSSMLFPRSHPGVCVLLGRMYVIGGFWSTQDLKKTSVGCIQCYDSISNSWYIKEQVIPNTAMVSAAVTWEQKLYILTASGRLFCYFPDEEKLRQLKRSSCTKGTLRSAYLINKS